MASSGMYIAESDDDDELRGTYSRVVTKATLEQLSLYKNIRCHTNIFAFKNKQIITSRLILQNQSATVTPERLTQST